MPNTNRENFYLHLKEIVEAYEMGKITSTPPHVLASFLMECLNAYDTAHKVRAEALKH